jgi:hypothetical protein
MNEYFTAEEMYEIRSSLIDRLEAKNYKAR